MDKNKEESLEYHLKGKPGKIEVISTKSTISSQDLSKAYSPGVAYPCLEISKNPEDAYKYTSKGNLVGVISNGSAVLGLGNIGPLASKPVMEGKGVLFKKFADIDVFDIEIKEDTIDGFVRTVQALEPTFGGINLEDIKAPECFEIERILKEKLNIPVFHDDQHGTAIIAAAGFLNAIELSKKKINKVKIVFSGAGAAAISCARLFTDIGVKKENIIMCDSLGVVYKDRKEKINEYKKEFASETSARTLKEAIKKADAFIGLSIAGILTKEMVSSMATNPIIFAMANPKPEIHPDDIKEVRNDAYIATGRSDLPNQINNVLGFPFIFRGALDVRAKKINNQMKLAAVKALAALAKEEVPQEVKLAYSNQDFKFGREYFIPKPFDSRVLTWVAPAVAKAAMETKEATKNIDDLQEYSSELRNRLGTVGQFMKSLRDKLKTKTIQNKRPFKLAFAEGSNSRILHAVKILRKDNYIEPILLGNSENIHKKMDEIGLADLKDLEIIEPKLHKNYQEFYTHLAKSRERKGVNLYYAKSLMKDTNYFGSMLVKYEIIEGLISGPTLSYPNCLIPIINVIGTKKNAKAAGIYILVFKNRILFFADCTVQINPNSEDLSEIAINTAELFINLMQRNPRIAFLSFSSYGSSSDHSAKKVKEAVKKTKEKRPELIVDGEMQADFAVNDRILNKIFEFNCLKEPTDILIFPELNSANISYKLIQQLTESYAIGPILVPMKSNVNIIQRSADVTEIANMCTLTALLKENDKLI